MKRLLAVILLVAVFVLSCGQASQNTGLRLMLSDVPEELASDNVLWFNSMERIKELAGVEPGIDANDFINPTIAREDFQRRMDLMAGCTLSNFDGGMYLEEWQNAFGFDVFDTSQEIWAESLIQPNSTRPLFSWMKGDFDQNNVIGKLNSLGYQFTNYASIDYYSINADNQLGDIKSSPAARMAKAYLNRVMVSEQEFIAAPADDIFFSVLDVRSGKQDTLADSLAYTRVAEFLGDVLGAALVPQSVLRSENVSTDWDMLHTYDLASIGYQVEGQDRKIVIVLHYADKSASDDVDELAHRMAEYKVTTGNLETPLLSDLFSISDPRVTNYDTGSILKIELVYKPDTPSTLWSDLVVSRDLGFLLVDPLQ